MFTFDMFILHNVHIRSLYHNVPRRILMTDNLPADNQPFS